MEVNPKDGYYSLGLNTLKVPMTLFDENRQRLANALRSNPGTPSNAVVLLQAGGEMGEEGNFSPAPIMVESNSGQPSVLFSVDDLELGVITIDCVVGEDVGEEFQHGESTDGGE